MKKRNSFTLAEVLVTLAVIGLIASMTIPSIIHSYSEKETVTKVTNTYAILSRATIMIIAECDGNVLNCISNPNAVDDDATAMSDLAALYKPKLKAIKDCGTGEGCLTSDTITNLNGNPSLLQDTSSNIYKMTLSNGMILAIDWNGLGHGSAGDNFYELQIDINGKKSPNRVGRDIFVFTYNYNSGYLEPCSYEDCNTSDFGYGCAQKILLEKAINY